MGADGRGLIVTKNVSGIPTQLLTDGVTIMVAVIGLLLLLTVVKEGILPVPLAASPIDGLLFVQL